MSSLQAEPREANFSKGQLNKFRKEGKVPAVVFGKGMEAQSLWVDMIAFNKCYHQHGKVFEMKFGKNTETVNAKFIDTNPLGKVMHISFHILTKGEKTTMKVAVNLDGESVGAKAGGIVQQLLDTIIITALPKDVPESVHVDISALDIGSNLTVGDIKLPKGLEIDEAEAEKVLVTCQAAQKQEEVAEVATETEAPAAGEAPAPEES